MLTSTHVLFPSVPMPVVSPLGSSFSGSSPSSPPPPSNANPWKMAASSTLNDGASTPPPKSLKDIMYEEKQEHEKQHKEERKGNLRDCKRERKLVMNATFYQKKSHQQYSNNHENNYNYNNHNNTHSNKQYSQTPTSWQPTKNKHHHTNLNNKKKMKNNNNVTSAKRQNQYSKKYNSRSMRCQNSIQDQNPEFVIPTLSHQMSQLNGSNHNDISYAMMSCNEYYEITSYKDFVAKPATKYERKFIVSLDCEMVGVGEFGERSALARVCIINWDHEILLDAYVKVDEEVTDYRTFVSGIRDADIHSDTALEFMRCRDIVRQILKGKILVGHGLENDLSALCITHPKHAIRDTAKYPLYMTATLVSPKIISHGSSSKCTSSIPPYSLTPSLIESDCSSTTSSSTISSNGQETTHNHPGPMMQLKPRKLKEIARERLGISIQKTGEEHSPFEDAYAALELYKTARVQWEKLI